MTFSIYLPPQAKQAPVPVLYWLSGLTCTDENFVTKAGAQQYAAEYGVAIVCPDTSPRGEGVPDDEEGSYDFGLGAGFYVNATEEPWATHYQMYDYVVEELPALINAEFPVDGSKVAISGHSMGGHGALTIALKNPERYCSVSAFSPICSPINCPWGQKALSKYIGDESRGQWNNQDTVELVKSAGDQLKNSMPVLIDQGDADNFLAEQLNTQLLIDTAEQEGFPMQIRFQSGYDHSYFFIASLMGEHIKFHSNYLR
jgi:S-formylglutathione hydrolase